VKEMVLSLLLLGGYLLYDQVRAASFDAEFERLVGRTEVPAERIGAARDAAGMPNPGLISPGDYGWAMSKNSADASVRLHLDIDGTFVVTARVDRETWWSSDVHRQATATGRWKQEGAVLTFIDSRGAVGLANGPYVLRSVASDRWVTFDGRTDTEFRRVSSLDWLSGTPRNA
jgi:hypothetical protein